jgi:hypothetical protein
VPDTPASRRFTLNEANTLLPTIRRMTDQAIDECEPIVSRMESLEPSDTEYRRLATALSAIVDRWSGEVRGFGVEVKGLWLVDFDNGEGYYCWQHPESSVTHFHGYEDGFKGRMKIV